MSKETMKLALEAAYLAGWNASGEGYNSEYPFGDHARNPEEDAAWIKDRDNALRKALAEQPAQRKYCRGDRLICIETEEYCVIHISGTDRQWVKFPDTHIGVYKNEQLAELFELLPKEIEIEQPAQQLPFGVGGGLVAIKTLLSRDPCVHANTAIEMIDAILAEQPAQRTWVGLTEPERLACYDLNPARFASAIEAKLKERNT